MSKNNHGTRRRRLGEVPPPDSASDTSAPDNARSLVEQRAYERFIARGGMHGSDLEDWLEAERDVLAGRGRR